MTVNKKNIAQAGFTLIELLVVIAIIGILSGIVLTSLNSARNKANDAKIKADLAGLRSTAEIFYSDNGNSYLGLCADFVTKKPLIDYTDNTCVDEEQKYAISVPLVSDSTKSWCVDSEGNSDFGTNGTIATCPIVPSE